MDLHQRILRRKYLYVYEALNYLDCEKFCVYGAEAKELASQYGIDIPDELVEKEGTRVSARFSYDFDKRGDQVEVRVNWQSHWFEVAVEDLIDLAYMHYAKLIPIRMIESKLKHDALQKVRDMVADVDKNMVSYGLHSDLDKDDEVEEIHDN